MNLQAITQWLVHRGEKRLKIKLDRQRWLWGFFTDLHESKDINFEGHISEMIMSDVTLKVTPHYSGLCGTVGYAEGKPVVEGQHVPDRATVLPLIYSRGGDFYLMLSASRAQSVTSLKFMWLLPEGKAFGIQ